jgi:signal transduction histidine kinase
MMYPNLSTHKRLLILCLMTWVVAACAFGKGADKRTIQLLNTIAPYQGVGKYEGLWSKVYADASKRNVIDDATLCELYYNKEMHFYYLLKVDSVRNYFSKVQTTARKSANIDRLYFSWLILCDTYIASGQVNQAISESDRMYKSAKSDKSEIGMAYSGYVIANSFNANRNYQQAAINYLSIMPVLIKYKKWDLYPPTVANCMNSLIATNRMKQAEKIFLTADSIADHELWKNKKKYIMSILEVKGYMSSMIYSRTKNSRALKKYLDETDNIYNSGYPHLRPIPKYFIHRYYAQSIGDYRTELQYLDSCVDYYVKNNDSQNLCTIYRDKSVAYEKLGDYENALKFEREYSSLNDSLLLDEQRANLEQLSTEYGVNKLAGENQALQIKVKDSQIKVFILLLATLLIVIVIILVYTVRMHKLNTRLRAANDIKNNFISSMSHEMRTPLNAILGFSDLLVSEFDDEEHKDMVKAISKGSSDFLKIVDDTLYLADNETGTNQFNELTEAHAAEFCEDMMREMADFSSKDRKLVCDTSTDVVFMTNLYSLKRIISNLLLNAFKFASVGDVELKYEVKDKNIEFSVTDHGDGIDEDFQEKIFEQFFKCNPFSQGLGVGLTICLIAAKHLNGTLKLDKEYKNGAKFVFSQKI